MARRNSLAQIYKDRKKVASVVKRFNAKLTRVTNKEPLLAQFQPQRLNVDEIMKGTASYARPEFNRLLAVYERYLKPGAEQIVETEAGAWVPKWYRDEAEKAVKLLNRRRAKEAEKVGLNTDPMVKYSPLAETIPQIKNYAEKADSNEAYAKRLGSMLRAVGRENPSTKAQYYKKNVRSGIQTLYGKKSPALQMLDNVSAQTLYDAAWHNNFLDLDWHYNNHDIYEGSSEGELMEQLKLLGG